LATRRAVRVGAARRFAAALFFAVGRAFTARLRPAGLDFGFVALRAFLGPRFDRG
jgi:hypothetical protein